MALLFVLSGPSGVGKDSLLARIKAACLPLHFAVTATTRPPRACEVDGRDYYLSQRAVSRDEGERRAP